MHLGPQDILLNLEIDFRDGVSASEQVAAVSRIEDAIRRQHPAVKRIFIEARRPDEARSHDAGAFSSPLAERRSAR